MTDTVNLTKQQQKILDVVGDQELLPSQIAEELGIPDARIIAANLGRLTKSGHLSRDKHGRFARA